MTLKVVYGPPSADEERIEGIEEMGEFDFDLVADVAEINKYDPGTTQLVAKNTALNGREK